MNRIPEQYRDLNALAQRVHQANVKWWQHPVTKERVERNQKELLMLVITELAEACEGERKNLMDDKLPHRKMAEVEMADALIRLLDFAAGFELKFGNDLPESRANMPLNKGEALFCICSMLAGIVWAPLLPPRMIQLSTTVHNTISMIITYCDQHNYDLWGAFEEKMKYNETREDHKHEARLQAGGKQW